MSPVSFVAHWTTSVIATDSQVFVRSVTYHYVGRIVGITDEWLELEDAAWVADSGRWHDALRDGTLDEVEPYVGNVLINRAAIVDVTTWDHELPLKQR